MNTKERIEQAIQSTDWQIEGHQKYIAENLEHIKNLLESEYATDGGNAASILNYAQHLNESAEKLRDLREQRRMLEYIGRGEENV